MSKFDADQPRQFVLDSSRQNPSVPGKFQQDNNRYVLEVMLYDNSIPVELPEDVDISVCIRATKPNSTIYVMDKNVPEFSNIVSYEPGTNVVKVNKWAAMVETAGQIMFAVTVGGVSTYTALYSVDENKMRGPRSYHNATPVLVLAKADLTNVSDEDFAKKAKTNKILFADLSNIDVERLAAKMAVTSIGKTVGEHTNALRAMADPTKAIQDNRRYWAVKSMIENVYLCMSSDEVFKMMDENRYEVMDSVDFAAKPYSDAKILHIVYQLSGDDQVIKQVLPAVASEKVLVIEIIRAKNVTGGHVEFTANVNDRIEYYGAMMVVSEDGYTGYFQPNANNNVYEFHSHFETQPYAMVVRDRFGQQVDGVSTVSFDNAEIVSVSNGHVVLHVDVPDISVVQNGVEMVDKKLVYDIDKKEFTVKDK